MDVQLSLNSGIIKKGVEGDVYPWVLKDLRTQEEYKLSKEIVEIYGIKEFDLVEFAGSIKGHLAYLAISQVQFSTNMN